MVLIALADYYELLVKEYLEQKGFVVRLNVKFLKNTGYSDIDVLAVNLTQETTIVGEVKAPSLSRKEIEHENEDFNDPHLGDKIRELLGHSNFEKYMFCWSVEDSVKTYALKNFQIKVVEFWEIINFLIEKVINARQSKRWIYDQSYPNTMLLQMLHDFSEPYKGIVRVNLAKLQGHAQ
jgi:hypothetical protein